MRTRSRGILVRTACAVAILLAPVVARAQTGETIRSFASDVLVREDGTVDVSEKIDYYFPAAKHGIYRDIPIRYKNDQGKTLEVPVTVTGVDDGQGHPREFEIQKNDAYLRVKIGDPNATVVGDQEYDISYVVSGAIRYFGDHDELYWNVTGDGWQVPVQRVNANVRLPAQLVSDQIDIKCFTGPTGSTAQDCIGNKQGSSAQFASSLAPLTVVVGFPKGTVAVLEAKEVKPFSFFGLSGVGLAFLAPILTLLAMIVLWWKRGRDPQGSPTLVVQYDPPDGVRPAEMGTLMDEKAGLTDISATIVDLAVRGYLKIKEVEKQGLIFKSKDYEFDRMKDYRADSSLKPYERKVLDTLFSGDGKVCTVSGLKESHDFYEAMPKLKGQLFADVVELGYYQESPDATRNKVMLAGALIAIGGWFIAPILFGWMLGQNSFGASVSVAACGVIVMLFAPFMPHRTAKGVAALEHAWGFNEYLEKAEKYRLQWQEQEGMFEKFLPYAMVLGVADKWAAALSPILTSPPEWYEGRTPLAQFNAGAFVVGLNSLDSSMMAAMKSAPPQTSSGSGFSSGGGFSGGGFGGGGGGSW